MDPRAQKAIFRMRRLAEIQRRNADRADTDLTKDCWLRQTEAVEHCIGIIKEEFRRDVGHWGTRDRGT